MKRSDVKYPELLEQFLWQPKIGMWEFDWTEMLKRRWDGESILEIAKAMGCAYSTVHTVVTYNVKKGDKCE